MRVDTLQADLRAVPGLPAPRVEPWRGGTDFFADLAHDGDRGAWPS